MNELLAEVTEHPPCGPYLEYDPLYQELERIAGGKAEQRLGDNVIPAEPPDWSDLKQKSLNLFSRTKDLRVAALLTRALVRTEGISGLSEGLSLVRAMLERYWDDVHPKLEIEGEHDPAVRLNTLAFLSDSNALLADVRNALIVPSGAMGRVSVRDLLIATGKFKPAGTETAPQLAQISAAITVAASKDSSAFEAARHGISGIDAIRALLLEKLDPAAAPDMAELLAVLKAVAQAYDDAMGIAPRGGDQPVTEDPAIQGEIRDRDDAIRQLEKICLFFERTEPGNPAPLLIRRAQRLMNKSFVEIIQDLAPDSLGRIQDIAGVKKT
ncbi:type VI secretion system protein ImpA [Duganella sp. CF458]|uniref:type VI secretion system protein TssA n=1 Tax=Duganella sp. CF458 TaxID=1884368 RepID=UPI0008DF021F|nr:type VI secretion system protein TssA [Duganella sp. CF458]SFG09267.1 type VI secretion system protein ImpA [Duganella sp. CF458]